MPARLVPIFGKPGVLRDGTLLAGDNYYTEALWTRFQRNLPRKMGGYEVVSKQFTGNGRGMYGMSEAGSTYLHVGSEANLERITVDNLTGLPTGVIDRTPAGFVADANNAWSFSELFDTVGVQNFIIAHAAPWVSDIANDTVRNVYVGSHTGVGAFTAVASVGPLNTGVSGGVAVFYPYAVYFGSQGYFQWSVPLIPTDVTGAGSGETRITADKIVFGAPLRASAGNAPSGLLWSLSSLVRASFIGGTPVFAFDTLGEKLSILSPRAVVEYDGRFYWPNVDRFLTFNGVVQEVKNDMNSNHFFDGLNYDQRGKIFGYKVPRFGEIWWPYPRGTATECTHAIILKVTTGDWYDTELPNGGRSCGFPAQQYRYPFMLGTQNDGATGKKVLWQHEKGVNEVDGAVRRAIRSYFITHVQTAADQGESMALQTTVVEPDFIQTGNLEITVLGRANARAADQASEVQTVVETPTTPAEQIVAFKATRRQLQFKVESNALDGDYQAGLALAHLQASDSKIQGDV